MTDLSYSQQPSIIALAREGNFRALAYWLNSQLVPQGIYVHIQAAKPGCLRALVEFHRMPERDRLVRFLCHRVWQLESEMIEGIVIVARYIGDSKTLWQRAVRIPTRSERQQRSGALSVQTSQRKSPLPPQIRTPRWWHLSFATPQQLKLVRAFLLSGSAIAAFLMGCWLEALTSQPSLPVIAQQPSLAEVPVATPVVQRPDTVRAALETVGVIQHEAVANPQDPTVTLVFGGEVSPENLNVQAADAELGSSLASIAAYQQADLSMVNVSEPLASAATSLQEEYYNRRRPDSAEVLRRSGVDIVNLSSNQALAYGETGITETLRSLDQAGIYRMGTGRDEREIRRPEILDVKGQRIAYLGYTGSDSSDGSVGSDQYAQIAEDIQAIRDQVDWIVVNYAWGQDLTEAVEDWQVDLARFAVDQGADLVVGHHPKVLQGAEVYKGRPIAYSLGDLVSTDSFYTDYDTAVLQVSLRSQQMKVEFLPITVQETEPKLVEGDRGEKILDRIRQASQAFEEPMQFPMILDTRQEVEPTGPVDPSAPFIETPSEGDFLETPGPLLESPLPEEFDIPGWGDPEAEPLTPIKNDLKPTQPAFTDVDAEGEAYEPTPNELESNDTEFEFEFHEDGLEPFSPEIEGLQPKQDEPIETEPASLQEEKPKVMPDAPLAPEGEVEESATMEVEPQLQPEKAVPKEPPLIIKPVEEPMVGPLAEQPVTPPRSISFEIARTVKPDSSSTMAP